MNKLMILDGNSIVNRAFYGIRLLTNAEGLYTNAIYGFLNILFKYMELEKPTHICVAFDVNAPTFRHEQFTDYKAKRKGMPDELAMQMPVLKDVLSAMNISQLELPGYEADDIIGTVSRLCEENKIGCMVLTGDKDDLQLATDLTKIMLITTKGTTNDTTTYIAKTVIEKYGVTPCEFIDVKALMGDPSDNIPGVAGVGEKTAFDLIRTYKTLDNVYEHINELKPALQKKLTDSRDIAYLSRKLATIDRYVPIEINIPNCEIKGFDNQKLTELFTRLNFSSFIQKFELANKNDQVYEYTLVSLNDIKKNITSPLCYFLSKNNDKFIFSAGNLVAEVEDIKELKDIFEGDIEKISHNVKEDIVLLKNNGIEYKNLKFDTMIAAYLIAPERSNYNINELSLEYLSKGVGGENPISAAAANAQAIRALYEFFAWELAKNNQADLYYDIELPLIKVLADMQIIGFQIDKEKLQAFSNQLDIRINELTSQIYELAEVEFNINSPKQLGEILFEKLKLPVIKKTKTGYSTNVEVLNELEDKHEIISHILEYRTLVKLKSTYVDGLLSVINPKDGRIHSSFNQTVTTTGRISSTEPNLQNIPIRTEIGREIRRAFVAKSPDYLLLDADYSQIELRVLAHIAKDDIMIDAFRNNMDIHTKTASEVFDVSPEFVTSQMRSRAKAVNFGIVYGIGDFSLAQDLKISRREAKAYIEEYLKTYPNVKQYMHDTVESAKEKGYITTLLGRRRYIPELKASNFNMRSFGERVAMNAPIQGSAADIIKIAMVRVHNRLTDGGFKSRLILQVHDELLVETHINEKNEVKQIIMEEMEKAYNMSVPLVTDLGEGVSWYDSK